MSNLFCFLSHLPFCLSEAQAHTEDTHLIFQSNIGRMILSASNKEVCQEVNVVLVLNQTTDNLYI